MVALVAGMALHLDVHPAVENLQAEVDLIALSVLHYPLVTVDAVRDAYIVRNVLAKTGERDDVGEAIFVAGVDGVLELFQTHIMILWVVHSFIESVAAENSADEIILSEGGPVPGFDQLDAFTAKMPGYLAGLLDVPVLLETPVNDGLIDSALDGALFVRCANTNSGTRAEANGRSAGAGNHLEHTATADMIVDGGF